MSPEQLDGVRARIAALSNTSRPEHEGSQIALMFEMLRRTALWARALGRDAEWPFFAIGAAIGDDVTKHLSMVSRRIAQCHLAWCANEDRDDLRALGLPAPYEPGIVMIERGGIVHIEQRMFQLHVASFPMRKLDYYLDRAPFAELDAASLDRLDAEWKLATR
jgi:hypothetical protein